VEEGGSERSKEPDVGFVAELARLLTWLVARVRLQLATLSHPKSDVSDFGQLQLAERA
jgi:hypothetical protein